MTKVNLINLREEARHFAHDVVLPLVDNADEPWEFVSELIAQAIRGHLPEWFTNEIELGIESGTLELDEDISLLDYFQAVVIELPTWLL